MSAALQGNHLRSTPHMSSNVSQLVNGSVSGGDSDKWCSLGATKFLRIDLGASTPVGRFVIRHSGAGGEPARWNTRDFDIQTSPDGDTADVTTHTTHTTPAPTPASYA